MYSKLLAVVGLSSLAAAAAQNGTGACARLTAQYKQEAHHNKTQAATLKYDAGTAYECLQSMPFDSDRAADYITELKKYMQWQSTVEALKNPPATYLSPAVDVLGGLDNIYESALNNEFDNHYAFDLATFNLLKGTQDGHLSFVPCSMEVFSFSIDFPLVSVSKDGLQLPEIYNLNDGYLLQNSSKLVSPVSKINGQDATSYLTAVGLNNGMQDPDARWNIAFNSYGRQFYEGGKTVGVWDGEFSGGKYPGHAINTIEFANGTVRHVPTKAKFLHGAFDYSDGNDLWEDVCIPAEDDDSASASSSVVASSTATPTPSSTPSSTPASSSAALPTATPLKAYPKPVVHEPEYNLLSGYYLPEKDLKDVAVLYVASFEGTSGTSYLQSFRKHATEFVKKAKAAGKKKIIVDLTGNPGGSVDLGMDLFELFFPKTPLYQATRMRSHEGTYLIGKALQNLKPTDEGYSALFSMALDNYLSPNQTDVFHSWEQVYGPYHQLNTNVSSLTSSNFTLDSGITGAGKIRGYGVKNNESAAPFAVEDILIVTDGFCSSTCTVFTHMMQEQGVKTLAFGGRPQYGPMQAAGGVRGAQVLEAANIYVLYEGALIYALKSSLNSTRPLLTDKQYNTLNSTSVIPIQEFPFTLSTLGVNFRNNYRRDNHVVPLQFLYEAADCRLFFTFENVIKPQTQWVAAARAFWGDAKCVAGSTRKGASATPSFTRIAAATATPRV